MRWGREVPSSTALEDKRPAIELENAWRESCIRFYQSLLLPASRVHCPYIYLVSLLQDLESRDLHVSPSQQ